MKRRTRTPGHDRATARVIWPSLVFVALIAGTASYLDALTVMHAAIGRSLVAFLVAILADPVILAASANIRDAHRHGAGKPKWHDGMPKWSLLSLGVAIGMTIYLNVMAAYPHDVPPWLVRAWVPVAFLLTLESLMSYTKRGRGDNRSPVAGDPPAAASLHMATPATPTREWLDSHLRTFRFAHSEREVAEVLGISRGRVATATMNAPAPEPPSPNRMPGAGVYANGSRPSG
jgi:hypothetical protein